MTLNQTRPACVDLLPADPECAAWLRTQERLIAQRTETIALRDRVLNAMPDRLSAAKFEGNFGVIANLARSETNLIRRLRGERIGSGLEGGVFRGDVDATRAAVVHAAGGGGVVCRRFTGLGFAAGGPAYSSSAGDRDNLPRCVASRKNGAGMAWIASSCS